MTPISLSCTYERSSPTRLQESQFLFAYLSIVHKAVRTKKEFRENIIKFNCFQYNFSKKVFFTSSKSSVGSVETLLFVKFILFSNDLAQGMVNVAGPPYSASLVLSIDFTIPLATARTMTVLIGHPCSLSFKIYCCIASSTKEQWSTSFLEW